MQTLHKYLNFFKSLPGNVMSSILTRPFACTRQRLVISSFATSSTHLLWVLVFLFVHGLDLKALDKTPPKAPLANFGASNYPCNAKMPWVDSSFTGLSASVIDPAANGLACVGSNSGTSNLLDNDLSNFASINFTVGLGGCNSTLSIVDTDAGDTYAAGTFAGFRIGTAGLIGVSIGSSVTIATYNNGSPVESQIVVNSGLGLNSSLLNGDGTATVGFITTAAFDEIRITYQSLLSALFTGTVYHAVVQRYCAGPSLACNTQTRMNNPTYPTAIDGSNTGLSGGVCVGCSVNNAENAISSSTSDFATIVLTAALGTTGSIAIKDQVTDYAAGAFAGFDIENPSLINANLLSGITIRTYLNGSPREVSNSGTLLSLSSSLLTGSGKQTVGFVTTLSFDEVKIEVTNFLGVAQTTNVYGAVFQSFCAGPNLACNTQTTLSTPTYPVLINGVRTGITGIACVACSVDSTQNLIDNVTGNSARINLTAGVGAVGSISVKEQITDYPAGTFAGFEIENTALLDVSLLGGITIATYLDGNPVESKTGTSALLSVNTGLLTGNGRRTVGFVTTGAFDEVRISVSNTLSVNLGITRVYSLVLQKFCPVTLTCNTTNYLNTPTFPVIVNDERTGISGVACVGCSVQNTPNVISSSTTDFATITVVAGVAASGSISVKDVLTTFPLGSTAGFVIRDVNTLLQLELFNSITISTYNNGTFQESRSGSGLLDLAVLNLLNISLTGSNDYNIGFRTTLPYDEVRISVGSLASVINVVRVYGAFVDTRGADDSNLDCCPKTAPILSANTLANTCPTTTVNLNNLVTNFPPMSADTTVRWFTNNTATGNHYATPTSAGAGTYYAFFYDTVDSCYGPASGAVVVTISQCPPDITSNGGGPNASVSVPENTTPVTTVVATDPEAGAITYSITGGADAAKFTINATTGALSFVTAPDFENPTDVGTNNVYDVQVTATDPLGGTDVQNIAVTVTDVNEAPMITSDGGGATANIPVVENTTAVTTVTATDPENLYGTPKFSISGGADAAKFSIDPNTGALSFVTAPDFEVPTDANADNIYEVTVRVTDAGGLFDEQVITVPVTNANENPDITSNGGGPNASVSVPENTTPVTTVVATDPEAGAITYSITGGADAAKFTINATTGALSFVTAPDFENPTDAGTNNVYNVQVTATDPLGGTDVQNIAVTVTDVNEAPMITSDGGGATANIPVAENTTAVTTVTATDPENLYGTPKFSISGGADAAKFSIDPNTGALSFVTAPDFEVPTDANADNIYEVTVRVTDAGGLFDEQVITVPVTNANENPDITSNGGGPNASVSVPENTTPVTTVVATDPEAGAITYSITGGADAAKFTINATTGALSFVTAPDFENPTDAGTNNVYDVQVTATDPLGGTDVQNIAVTVTDVNEAPMITSDGGGATANIPVAENTTAVTTVTATDPENLYGTPKFSISGGADAAKFVIDPNTGALSFVTAPDFEVPTDANTDNIYEVTVRVTDAGGLFDEQVITVPVTNANENPDITTNGGGPNASVSIPENTTPVTTVIANDPDGNTPTYSITGGPDAAKFTIDPNTGLLSFINPPDFENPTDVGTNNVYDVEVTASDGNGGTDVQNIAVTVTDVAEDGKISVKVLLQGALYSSPTPGIMRDNLRSGNYIPLNDPYTGSGNVRFTHAGAGGAASTTMGVLSANAGTNNAIVDWVFVELRSSLDPTVVVETRAALLQRDGDVVDPADGISSLSISGTIGNQYYVAVKHRNHLGAMTASAITISAIGTTVDFRVMSDADVYNLTSPFSYDGYEMVTVNGFKALWAGNVNADRKIKYQGTNNDNALVINQVSNFPGNTLGVFNYDLALGYFAGDVNMDGKVKYQGTTNDPGFIFQNVVNNIVALNSLLLYNYDLFTEQIP